MVLSGLDRYWYYCEQLCCVECVSRQRSSGRGLDLHRALQSGLSSDPVNTPSAVPRRVADFSLKVTAGLKQSYPSHRFKFLSNRREIKKQAADDTNRGKGRQLGKLEYQLTGLHAAARAQANKYNSVSKLI